jgi:hypothetical protein
MRRCAGRCPWNASGAAGDCPVCTTRAAEGLRSDLLPGRCLGGGCPGLRGTQAPRRPKARMAAPGSPRGRAAERGGMACVAGGAARCGRCRAALLVVRVACRIRVLAGLPGRVTPICRTTRDSLPPPARHDPLPDDRVKGACGAAARALRAPVTRPPGSQNRQLSGNRERTQASPDHGDHDRETQKPDACGHRRMQVRRISRDGRDQRYSRCAASAPGDERSSLPSMRCHR